MEKQDQQPVAGYPNGSPALPQADITPDEIKKELLEEENLFEIKPALEWIGQASQRPTPKMLFDVFWFEQEVCILFADSNVGKSILAVQIADSISRGSPIDGFHLGVQAQPILYIDFELSDKQFEMRYRSKDGTVHSFDTNFLRAEINADADIPERFKKMEDFVLHSLEQSVLHVGSQVVIVDNITFLGSDNEKAKDALPLMKGLKALKNKYSLSILVLAHTPKRNISSPITRNDLAGSKMLINFCDSAFAIGESQIDSAVRYLKQIKCRNTEIRYDADNVRLASIEKSNSFLCFRIQGFDVESNHLRLHHDNDLEDRNQRILSMKQEGNSNRAIADMVGLSEAGVRKVLKKFEERP